MNLHKSKFVCRWLLIFDVVKIDCFLDSVKNGIIISAKCWSTVDCEVYSERNFLEHVFPDSLNFLVSVTRLSHPIKLFPEVLEIQITDEKESELWTDVLNKYNN